MGVDLEQRFWDKVTGEDESGCWNWTAAKNNHGYGIYAVTKRDLRLAHRLAFEFLRSEVPRGLVLDHLCRTPSCINPWHLDPVTQRENLRRGKHRNQFSDRTACTRGHAYTPENTLRRPNGERRCRTCVREQSRTRRLAINNRTENAA